MADPMNKGQNKDQMINEQKSRSATAGAHYGGASNQPSNQQQQGIADDEDLNQSTSQSKQNMQNSPRRSNPMK